MENYTSSEAYYESTQEEKKVRRTKKKKSQKKDKKITIAMVAIITAFIVFIVLLVIQDRIVNEGITRAVVVATKDIPAGTKLTQENMPNYMAVEVWPEEQIPDGAYANGYGMVDRITGRDIKAKELLTESCFYEISFFDEVQDPVEISIALGDLGRAVAGTLRAGDLVDIKTVIRVKMDEEDTENDGSVTNVDSVPTVGLEVPEVAVEGEATTEGAESTVTEIPTVGITNEEEAVILDMAGNVLVNPNLNLTYGVTGEYAVQTIAENVRVVAVYTSGGESTEQVEGAGGTMIATVINVVVPRSLQDSIYLAMAEGNIQLARVEVKDLAAEEVTQEAAQ